MDRKRGRGHTSIATRSLAGALFVALFALQVLSLEGHINTPDGQFMFDVSEAIVDRGAVDISPIPGMTTFGGSYVERGGERLFYAKYGLGLSLLALPPLLAGDAIAPYAGENDVKLFWAFIERIERINARVGKTTFTRGLWYDRILKPPHQPLRVYFATWTNCWIAAAVGTVLFLLGMNYGWGAGLSLGLAFSSNLLTPLWHYGGEFFSEPLSALCLVLLLFLGRVSLQEEGNRLVHTWLCGFVLGYAILAKAANVIVLPWLAVYLALGFAGRRIHARERWRWILTMASGAAGPLLIFFFYNYLRFGSIFETGYADEANRFTTPLLNGLYGLLFSPGRGAAWYFPPLLLAILGFRGFLARVRADAVFVGGVALTWLVVYAKWSAWEGGWCWGPRFLLPVMPLLLLPAASFARDGWRKGLAPKALIAFVGLAAFLVALSAVMVSYDPYYLWLQNVFEANRTVLRAQGYGDTGALSLYSWHYSPLWRYLVFPVRQVPVFVESLRYPGIVLLTNLAVLGLLLWSLASLLRITLSHRRSRQR